jgi:hypothetical protein
MKTNTYRIVETTEPVGGRTEYQVERLHRCRFLWWIWERWHVQGGYRGYGEISVWCPWAFESIGSAQRQIAYVQRQNTKHLREVME